MENKSQRNEKRFGASSTLQQRHSRMQPQVDDMDNSSVNQLIMTQHDDSGINGNQDSSLPSVKLSIAQDKHDNSGFDTCANLKNVNFGDASNLSAQNTTAGASVKVAAVNSQRNLNTKPVMLTSANNTGKMFAGIEEIPDENSAVVQNEQAATNSQGKWSSDMQDETLTLTHSLINEPVGMTMPRTSGFLDQNRN